jgi:hypothetical protein
VSAATSQALTRAGETVPGPLTPVRSLIELEQRIRVAHEGAENAWAVYTRAGADAVRRALEVGGLLEQAHEIIPYGEWYRWIEGTLPFSRKTADDYRRLDEHREVVEALLDDPLRGSDHSLRGALREIETVRREAGCDPAASPRRFTAANAARGFARQLETYTAFQDADVDRDELVDEVIETLEQDYEDVAGWARAVSDLWAEIAAAAADQHDDELEPTPAAPSGFSRWLLGGAS